MIQLWQYWQGGVNDEVIESIHKLAKPLVESNPGLGFDGSTHNNDKRHTTIKWMSPLDHPYVRDIIWHFAQQANKNAFGFDITQINDIQYTIYNGEGEKKGKYDWHCDTFWGNPTTQDRKISLVIQLSDPNEYEGGDFQLDPQYEQMNPELIKKKGSVIAFPSFLNHRVTPVTKGTRRSLVSWVEGPKFR